MIVRYPESPGVIGPLSLPRPAVFLLGSYDPKMGAVGCWYEEAARYLDQYVGTVFYGVAVGEFREDFISWYFFWLEQCDLAVIWLDRAGAWSQFEVGVVLGAAARHGELEVLVGALPELDALRRSLELVALHFGLELRIHDDLPTMLHAARAAAREDR